MPTPPAPAPTPAPARPADLPEAPPALARTLGNGLTVIVEPMRRVRSAAFALLTPAGSVHDPPGKNACAAVLCDLLTRGAGELDNRGFTHALDDLGVQRGESVGTAHLSISAAAVAENLPAALRLYRDMLRDPHLPEAEFAPAAAGLRQSLRAVEDEPAHRIMLELRRRAYPAPWGLPTEGTLAGLDSLGHADVLAHHRRHVRPGGTVLAVTGNVEAEAVFDLAAECFEDWPAGEPSLIAEGPRGPSRDHLPDADANQTQIALAYDSVPYAHADYYKAWAAVSVLSGGMSSRLFTEVREKRGLCYGISASQSGLKHAGRVFVHAGTAPDRAQQTLDVTVAELHRLAEGIEEGELQRCVARAKSGLVMSQESTSGRAGALVRDWYHLGRIKPLRETLEAVDALTVDGVLDYVRNHPPDPLTILTLGPAALKAPGEASD